MMKDFKQKGMDNYYLHKGGLNWISTGQTNRAKYSKAEVTLSENFSMKHEWHRLPGFIQKPLDLQLSADEFIGCSADRGKGVFGGSLQGFFNSGSTSPGEVLDLDDLKLSLSIGGNSGRKGGICTSRIGNSTSASSSEIIDLEDLNLTFSTNSYIGWTPGLAAKTISLGNRHMLGSVSQTGMRGNSYGIRFTESKPDIRPICAKLTSFESGSSGCSRGLVYADILSKNQTSHAHVRDTLDLNKAKLEGSSCYTIDHSVAQYASRDSGSCTIPTWKANVDHFPETQGMPRQLDLNVDLAVSYGDKISSTDLDSDSGKDFSGSRSNLKVESADLLSKPSNSLLCNMSTIDAAGTESNTERNAALTMFHSSQKSKAAEDLDCNKLCNSFECDCIQHQSSSAKTMQSGVKCADLNICTPDDSERAKMDHHSGEQNQRSSDSSDSNSQIIRQEPNVDELVQNAAESLVRISLRSHEVVSKEFQSEECDQPQCSADSYEEMVLKAKESDPDDYCATSNAFVVGESEKKENRHKLKRGTRMKDFQKDILPSLSILSRHEIREDINILEGVIRSREYKKMRAKFTDGSDPSRPTRSKRSKARCSRR